MTRRRVAVKVFFVASAAANSSERTPMPAKFERWFRSSLGLEAQASA
ncbi:MAG: hypothetical protein IPN03_19960 [Holophagales bacterium]|nr:hypothetical protein [Holophagales bacterium]